MKPNPIIWFEIYVQDMSRAQKFYETLLGCKLEALTPPDGSAEHLQMMAFPMEMNALGAGGALVKMEGVPSGPGGTLVYFSCEDCAVEEARATEAGGSVFMPKFSIVAYGFCSLLIDSEGNRIGLHSQR